jgi:adenine deaminase
MQLGIENRTGSIDVGKDADLVIFSQHPFSVYTVPEMTFIEGEIFFDRQADLAARETLKREKEELIRREREQRRGDQPGRREGQPDDPRLRPNEERPRNDGGQEK